MVLYTAGIQLLTRIYNVLFIEGEKSKSEPFKETNYLNKAMVYNSRLIFLSPSSGSTGKTGETTTRTQCF